jgi:hypothetical protein
LFARPSADLGETPHQFAQRTGRSVAAVHKLIQRETARQNGGLPPRFEIFRRGRSIRIRGAQ